MASYMWRGCWGVFAPGHEAPVPHALLLPVLALRGAHVAGPLAAGAA